MVRLFFTSPLSFQKEKSTFLKKILWAKQKGNFFLPLRRNRVKADKGLKWWPLAFMAPIVATIIMQQTRYRQHHTALIIVIVGRSLHKKLRKFLSSMGSVFSLIVETLLYSTEWVFTQVFCALANCNI